MKKLIIVGMAVVSVLSFADASTKKILEQYRKEALAEQAKTKVIKVNPEKKQRKVTKIEPVAQENVVVEEVVVEETPENVQDEKFTGTTEDTIEKVNFYLRNNPEKRAKLEQRYKTVVGHE